jgi:hypothetical protein
MSLEELHLALMLFSRGTTAERPQVATLACFVVHLPGIETILAAFQFANHKVDSFMNEIQTTLEKRPAKATTTAE